MGSKLTPIVDSGTKPRMGRKPLKINVETVVTTVRLSADVAQRIDELAGENKRSDFIREAVDREIKRRSRAPRPD